MSKKDEALKLALEALKQIDEAMPFPVAKLAQKVIREALEEQPAQQEPVAWKHDCAALLTNDVELWIDRCPHCGKPHTSPPAQRTWVGLTDEDVTQCSRDVVAGGKENSVDRFAYAIEAKLKEKNT